MTLGEADIEESDVLQLVSGAAARSIEACDCPIEAHDRPTETHDGPHRG